MAKDTILFEADLRNGETLVVSQRDTDGENKHQIEIFGKQSAIVLELMAYGEPPVVRRLIRALIADAFGATITTNKLGV